MGSGATKQPETKKKSQEPESQKQDQPVEDQQQKGKQEPPALEMPEVGEVLLRKKHS